jgi:hypothetical protein
MGYGFKLKPRAGEGYSPRARMQMEGYVRSHWPTSYQRSDGCFVLCDSREYRDEILASNTVDQVRDGYEHIAIRSHEVSIYVDLDIAQNRRIARFLEWSLLLWPAELRSEFDQSLTVDGFLEMMLSAED